MTDPLPLLPEAPSPRRCRCGRPVPKGRLIEGWGSGCAVEHGVTPAPTPRVPTHRQEGESLFDLLRWDTAGGDGGGRVAESPELRGRGATVNEMIEWLDGVLGQREATANASGDNADARCWSVVDDGIDCRVLDAAGEVIVHDEGSPTREQADHIALNDPKQILDDVKADRAVIAWYETTAGQLARARQLRLPHDLTQAAAVAYLDVVRVTAAKYATWPGYRTEWAPEGSRG